MPDVISFQRALDDTEDIDRTLLLGNGFSISHFSYRNLLEKTGLDNADPLKVMFTALKTFDFEIVIRALEDAVVVERTYGDNSKAAQFQGDSDRLRLALVHAVRETHPAHREDIADKIPACVLFLKNFAKLFTFNYDLLLYWVQLGMGKDFKDGFGLGLEENGFRGPFKENAYCNVYNLHGGLHLFSTAEGELEKRLMGASGVIDAIAQTITAAKRLPIYVAEGTSKAKMAKINTIPYLRHSYKQLSTNSGVLFVYGHSADPNDSHIYRAIFSSRIEHLYFCIHQPTADIDRIAGELARYKELNRSKIEYTFVDSESAHVWG